MEVVDASNDQRSTTMVSLPALSHRPSSTTTTASRRHPPRPHSLHASAFYKGHRPPCTFRCHSSRKQEASFTDRILDYIEGGPKLRKWYGAPDLLPRDGDADEGEEDSEGDEVERDAVLVTNGDSEIGQMVILSLILKRARVKAIVKDKRAAGDAFATYVESITADASGKSYISKALRGVRAVICPSNEGFLSNMGQLKGIQHIVLLSQLAAYRGSSGIKALMNSKARSLAERDEEAVITSGIPYTIIRAASLQDSLGGKEGFSFKEGVASKGKLSKEDAARICVEALDVVPQRGLVFEVANGEENISDWKDWFTSLINSEEQMQ